MDHQRPWSVRMAAGIGQRVLLYRDRQKLSAQDVADRCAEVGMPSITRTVITKLENGRRESVSTAELQVLAHALGIPAVLLLFPLGYAPAVEVLPGMDVDPWDAIRWFAGDNSGDIDHPADPAGWSMLGFDDPILLWRIHARVVEDIDQYLIMREHGGPENDRELGEQERRDLMMQLAEDHERNVRYLRKIRADIRRAGLEPPRLDARTARAIGEEQADGSR